MYFSLIVPTYNPMQSLPRLLDSIRTNDCKDEIEIILSDDCSDENFEEILDTYSDLCIYIISNDERHGFPRTGRQHGMSIAKGKWICFADQDDYFEDHAFDTVKEQIEKDGITNYIRTDFYEHMADGEQVITQPKTKSWTHGKFFENEFIHKYHICYENVEYCEDIGFCNKVSCIIIANNLPFCDLDDKIYHWIKHEDSLSQSNNYFVKSFPDYIAGTFGIIIDYVDKYHDNAELYNTFQIMFLQTLLHMYFYQQTLTLRLNENFEEQMTIANKMINFYVKQFQEITQSKNIDIINLMLGEMVQFYNETRFDDCKQIPFIEHETFEDWLTRNCPE